MKQQRMVKAGLTSFKNTRFLGPCPIIPPVLLLQRVQILMSERICVLEQPPCMRPFDKLHATVAPIRILQRHPGGTEMICVSALPVRIVLMPADVVDEGFVAIGAKPGFVQHLIMPYAHSLGRHKRRADVADDLVPRSLRSDAVHLNDAGYGVVALAFSEARY